MKLKTIIKENSWLILILILGTILRFYHIDYQSIWLDEIHTMNEANPNISFLDLYNSIMAGEQMPPLYFYTLYFIFKIFGYSTFIARAYSAVLGVISVFGIYVLGKELINKKYGLIAAFILCINFFHLYYSQDARPYIMLLVFSIFSFYRLILYIKQPTLRNALYYGLFSGLMISSHFFGLFSLFSQYLILLFFLLVANKQEKKSFFINSFLSGFISLIIFIPSIKIFIKVTQITEFWIPAPTLDNYTLIFREFFGNSELVLSLVSLFLFFYFFKLSKVKNVQITYLAIIKNKNVFNFLLIIPWIGVLILIPLIRSYVSTPMIISRYFIIVLPALILLITIGIQQFNNKIIQFGLLSFFFIFSMTDILIVKKYYKNVNKSQFREVTSFISVNNQNKEEVVSSLGWYMPYFFKNNKEKQIIVDKSLEQFLAEMQLDSTKVKSFWYADAHGRPFNLTETTQEFLEKNFYQDLNFDGFDAWTKHYILAKNASKTINISSFEPLQEYNGDVFSYSIEQYEQPEQKLKISGWAYFEKQNATQTKIELILIKDAKVIRMHTERQVRQDVTSYFNSNYNIDNSGFNSTFNLNDLEEGTYKVALYLEDKITGKKGLNITDKILTK